MHLSITEPFSDSDTWFAASTGFALNQGPPIAVFEALSKSTETKIVAVETLRIASFLELEYQQVWPLWAALMDYHVRYDERLVILVCIVGTLRRKLKAFRGHGITVILYIHRVVLE